MMAIDETNRYGNLIRINDCIAELRCLIFDIYKIIYKSSAFDQHRVVNEL